MHHVAETMLAEQPGNALAVGDAALLEAECRKDCQLGEPRALERRVIVGVQVVEPDDRPPLLQQAARHVIADESGRSGDENGIRGHASPLGSPGAAEGLIRRHRQSGYSPLMSKGTAGFGSMVDFNLE